jgi:hypothetical protein
MPGLRRAVVIGIDAYEKVTGLQGAGQDATEIRDALIRGNFDVDHFLIDDKATARSIRTAISDVFYRAKERAEIALLYFAGHGRKDRLDYGWLLPHDFDPDAPFVNGVRIQELKQLFLNPKLNIDTGIMILDCCYGGIATTAERDPGNPEAIEVDPDALHNELPIEEPSSQSLKSAGSGRFIWASARADAKAPEKLQKHLNGEEHMHGVYSFHLIEGLESGACDESGCVKLGRLREYLEGKFEGVEAKWQPQFFGAGRGESAIELTRSSAKFLSWLEERYSTVDKLLDDPSVSSVMAAIGLLVPLENARPDDTKKIEEYYKQADNEMDKWRNHIFGWWSRNKLKIFPETKSAKSKETTEGKSLSAYDEVNRVLKNLKSQEITKCNNMVHGCITDIIETIVEDLEDKEDRLRARVVDQIRRLQGALDTPLASGKKGLK